MASPGDAQKGNRGGDRSTRIDKQQVCFYSWVLTPSTLTPLHTIHRPVWSRRSKQARSLNHIHRSAALSGAAGAGAKKGCRQEVPDSCIPYPDPLALTVWQLWGTIPALLSICAWRQAGGLISHILPIIPSLEINAPLFLGWRVALRSQTHLAGLSVLVQDERHLGAVYSGR